MKHTSSTNLVSNDARFDIADDFQLYSKYHVLYDTCELEIANKSKLQKVMIL
jgi:hypothetical protein